VDKTIEPPPGCQEIPGFIVETRERDQWLTQSGGITDDWRMRGVWPTQSEAEAARDAFFADDRLY
jgi:hypothetical protein